MSQAPIPYFSFRSKKRQLPAQYQELVVVTNREPYQLVEEHGEVRVKKTTGGLVSALEPVLKSSNGLWICWQQEDKMEGDELLLKAWEKHNDLPYRLCHVPLTQEEIDQYYHGFANQEIWPLFHAFPVRTSFQAQAWEMYCQVNNKFAQAILSQSGESDLIWVQDYHMLMVPKIVREADSERCIGFFSHIPFPHYELFRAHPKRIDILEGMLGCDLIGFHTATYARYFIECVEKLLPDRVLVASPQTLLYEGRQIRIQEFPISIDYSAVAALAARPAIWRTVHNIRNAFGNVPYLGIGVDRLDYTKGILERLRSIEDLLTRFPEYIGKLVFIQIAVPSRTEVPEYQQLKHEIDEAVGRINGQFSGEGWSPIHYLYRSVPFEELVAYYQAADFALVNPLRDGMNLVAKEYCAARIDQGGALILSEMAGAACELEQAYIINPYDIPGTADMIHHVLHASSQEKQKRMATMRRIVAEHDIHKWLADYLLAFEQAIKERHSILSVQLV